MDFSSTHQAATRARQIVLLVLAAAALLIGIDLARDVERATDLHLRWERHPAEFIRTVDPQQVELEVAATLLPRLGAVAQSEYATPSQPDKLRVLLPAAPYALYDYFSQVEIALDPQQPGQAVIVDMGALGAPVLAKLAWLLALALVVWMLRRARWGEDQTWKDGQWASTAETASRAGASASAANALVETRTNHYGVVFWVGLAGVMAVTSVGWAVLEYDLQPIESGSMALGSLVLFALALSATVQTVTRRVRYDNTGLCDSTVFRTRRVPWQTITSLRRVNLNEAAQQRYHSTSNRSGSRPLNLMVWRIGDAADREILQLSETMSPQPVFEALRQRMDAQINAANPRPPHSGLSFGSLRPEAEADNVAESTGGGLLQLPPDFDEHQRSLQSRHKRFVMAGLALMVLPFAAAAAYATWLALWFLVAASVATGTVVEKSTKGLPSVVVAYPVADGQTLRVQSDGSGLYSDIALGDKIRVFYDPADPAQARLDLFLELWIGPLLLGALLLLVLLCAVLIGRSMTRPFARPITQPMPMVQPGKDTDHDPDADPSP